LSYERRPAGGPQGGAESSAPVRRIEMAPAHRRALLVILFTSTRDTPRR